MDEDNNIGERFHVQAAILFIFTGEVHACVRPVAL